MSAENVELVLGLFPAPDLDLAQLLRDENRWTAWTEANAPFVHPEAETAWPGLPDGKTYTGPVGFKGSVAGVAGSLEDISSGDVIDLGERRKAATLLLLGRGEVLRRVSRHRASDMDSSHSGVAVRLSGPRSGGVV